MIAIPGVNRTIPPSSSSGCGGYSRKYTSEPPYSSCGRFRLMFRVKTDASRCSINSTSREESVFHSAYVKKLYDQRYPGTYTAVNWLPVVPLFRDASVSSDALSYARAKQDWKLERNMYPEVYGRMGGDLVSQATSFIPGVAYLPFYTRPLLSGAGSIAGSATGEVIARQKEKQMTSQAQGINVLR